MNVGLLDQDQSPEEKAFAELSAQDREKYREFWRKSRVLRSALVTGLLLAMPIWIYPIMEADIPWRLAVAFCVVLAAIYAWLQRLHCPRCNAEFYGGLFGGASSFPSWQCYACELSHEEVKYIAKRTG